ncbi:MAG: SurA N-terminal domain-containing protein [Chitinophagales bacterium]
MSVIQKIRDKYARVAVIAIALAIILFILTDYIAGRSSSLFRSGPSNMAGRVNGKKIDIDDFRKKVKQQEDNNNQQQSYFKKDFGQIVDEVWNQEVSQVLLNTETDKLGMQIGTKEVNDILFGKNPPDDIKRLGTDQQTGQFNVAQAVQQINAIKKRGTNEQKASLNSYIQQLEVQRLDDKYNSLLFNSINFPRWFIEKQNTDNSLLAKISAVGVMYSDSMFVDSTIKISDAEIADYISKHKDEFKQQESRSVQFVMFSALPTAADSAETLRQVREKKKEFDTTADVSVFLSRNGTDMEYSDKFYGKSQIQVPTKDSIFNLSKNAVYGPYLDGSMYVLAKKMEEKTLPDSVKARHILIATNDPRSGTVLLDDSTAKKRIDSIALAIKKGARFDSLAKKLSDDKGSAEKGGLVQVQAYQNGPLSDYFAQGQMVQAFNDSCFAGKTGETKIVKTEFGYHYIEILDQKNFEPHYKIAYFAKRINASKETDDNASNGAAQFAGNSRDLKSFNENYEKNLKPKGIRKLAATDIDPNAYGVAGMPAKSRQFVKDIYSAKIGDVLQPEQVGDQYVVAVVTEINDEGTKSVAKARSEVEKILLPKKKAEIVKQKLGTISTLEAAATILKKPVEVIDSLRMAPGQQIQITGARQEPKVIGAAFNQENKGKVVLETIAGKMGIYVIRIDNVTATAVDNANVPMLRKTMYQSAQQTARFSSDPLTVLKAAATIKDNRPKFY